MTDVNFPTENQVVDFVAARAAKPAKLTAALFEEKGVKVGERPPSNPAPKSDLVPDQVTSKAEVLRQGAEAMARLSSNRSRDWADWLQVLAALGIGRHTAMLDSGSNKPRGYKYCIAFAKWLRLHETFQAIDQADRKRFFDCLDNLPVIEEWRASLAPAQLIRWNYPPTVLREWKKSQQSASSPSLSLSLSLSPPPNDPPPPAPRLLAPTELRRQLEILGLDRFRREVLPPDWRTPLADTALALATPNQLIATLEKKCSPSKATGFALRMLRKSQPSNP
jgi:hypothetical protein